VSEQLLQSGDDAREPPGSVPSGTEKRRPGARGLGRVYRRGPFYWVQFSWHGTLYRESSHSPIRARAVALLRRRQAEMGRGTFVGIDAEKVTFEDLCSALGSDYAAHGRVSFDSVERSLAHLREMFAGWRAVDITRGAVDVYIAKRLQEKAARATVRKEVTALSRAFNLLVQAGRLATRPCFTRLEVENTRTVSFTGEEFSRLLDVLKHGRRATAMHAALRPHPELVGPVLFAAVTGWRMTSDVLPLRWAQVDLAAGTVTRWSRGTSKAPAHVVFPIDAVPELKATLERQREATTTLEQGMLAMVPFVFHRGGRPIKNLRTTWALACAHAGVAGRWPHDLRRTSARTLRALGMSDRDIAELCGWTTVQMVSRYLGRDPGGVAERLRRKVSEASARSEAGVKSRSSTKEAQIARELPVA
jgi:integrase